MPAGMMYVHFVRFLRGLEVFQRAHSSSPRAPMSLRYSFWVEGGQLDGDGGTWEGLQLRRSGQGWLEGVHVACSLLALF
jgi:hypothetical protein